ncbi:ABC transporter ATP-binding protein [Ornithinimicrobium sp. F0845]|uniref:ABC transporter ATP-binding protein n=1 Tax=Ornithinimicrobium sp. F0845 TaxID=2926412 RepID=UPI001FF3245F|nr:ABC transporter ATP-binding protein [Ornithinimicrobium sp. F0845]
MAGDVETPALKTDSITKSYGSNLVLEELSLEVQNGEFVSLLGPSGCGKTTTLNIVSGFLQPDSGAVQIGGVDVTHTPAHKRDSAVVFQNYALFPHMTVEKNIRYGLKAKRVPREELKERVAWALRLVDILELKDRYPGQLSGGQQQRVAVARSLVMRPGILLMDEPLSNLDAKLRAELRLELKALQQDLGQSVLFVTHDQVEALSLSDRIVVMNRGHVEQVGTSREVYEHPATVFVARFMGVENVFELTRDNDIYQTAGGLHFPSRLMGPEVSAVGIRPSMLRTRAEPVEGWTGWASRGEIRSVTYLGDTVRYEVAVGDETLAAISSDTHSVLDPGSTAYLHASPESLLPLAT